MQEQNITDFKQETQQTWNACLMYCYNKLFKDTDKLKNNPNINNQYNFDVLYQLVEKYLFLCSIYNKIPNLYSFGYLTGIENNTFYTWYANDNSYNNNYKNDCNNNKLSYRGYDIVKRLINTHEQTLVDRIESSKTNCIGAIASLNHYHNWNMPGVTRENASDKQRLTRSDVELIAKTDEKSTVKSDILD